MFIISIILLLNNNFIQDAAPGDSGAPLYTLGNNSRPGEISDRYLIGIHSGGKDGFVAARLQRGNVFFPKWWIRVSLQRSYFLSIFYFWNDQFTFVSRKINQLTHFWLNFQIAQFSKWIKCTQKHATEGKMSTKNVERECDNSDINKGFPFIPKCNHTELHFNGILPYWNKKPYC